MKFRLKQMIIGAAMILLVTFLFIKTNVIDSGAHGRLSQQLRRLKELDATLDKDILESRYGLLTTYDLLITDTGEIDHQQAELNSILGSLEPGDQDQIARLLEEFAKLQEQKKDLIERFKSRNAILNNSLRYFPLATSGLIKTLPQNDTAQEQVGPLNNLLRDILTYYLLPSSELEPAIADRIQKLKEVQKDQALGNGRTDLDITVSHARTILKLKPEIDDLVKQIGSLPTANKLEEIVGLNDLYHGEATRRADTYRLLLYVFSVLLLAYIAFIIFKLKKATSALNSSNESLEQRVQERTEELSCSNVELQKSEEALRESVRSKDESLALLDTILATAPIGFAFQNRDLVYERINETLAAINGRSVEDHLGRTLREVLPEMADSLEPMLRRIIETGEPVINFELSGETGKDPDHIRHWLLNFYPIQTHGGEILGVGVLVLDITERKLLEEKLQRGRKLESIGQLAAGIAHEINTPTQYVGDNVRFLQDSFRGLTAVLEKTDQMVQLCRASDLLPEFSAEMEKTIEGADLGYLLEEAPKAFVQALDGVERISKIVQSMKDFAHPGSTEMIATDLNKAIESTITVASNEWKYVADIVTNYDDSLPRIPCLRGEFNQVILNMIVNAAHAITDVVGDNGTDKGQIDISTRRKGDWAEIRITDTGPGIPADIQKKIFDPFFTTKEVGKGTGQGLAISHTVIVDKHHGTIDVESVTGKGTSFVICLPLN